MQLRLMTSSFQQMPIIWPQWLYSLWSLPFYHLRQEWHKVSKLLECCIILAKALTSLPRFFSLGNLPKTPNLLTTRTRLSYQPTTTLQLAEYKNRDSPPSSQGSTTWNASSWKALSPLAPHTISSASCMRTQHIAKILINFWWEFPDQLMTTHLFKKKNTVSHISTQLIP